MKILSTILVLTFISANSSFAASAPSITVPSVSEVRNQEIAARDPNLKGMKDILAKLIRQDEYLDEAIKTLSPGKGTPNSHDLLAVGLSLKLIKSNLDRISALSQKHLAEIKPGSQLSSYTRTILSYSQSISRKTDRITQMTAKTLRARNSVMRDAPAGTKGKRARKAKGKKLVQLMEEHKALETLSTDTKNLRVSAKKLKATSKWLYVASK